MNVCMYVIGQHAYIYLYIYIDMLVLRHADVYMHNK